MYQSVSVISTNCCNGDVLAENGKEPRIEPPQALFSAELRETGDQASRVIALRHETYASRFKRGEKDICEEPATNNVSSRGFRLACGCYVLSNARSAEVYRCAVFDSSVLVSSDLRELLLPEFVSGELCASLENESRCHIERLRVRLE